MVGRGEYQVAILVDIIVFFFQGGLRTRERGPDLVRRRSRIIRFERKSRGGLKASSAQARRVETSRGQDPKDMTWYDDFVTPARPLIKMTFRHPAPVVTAAHRALFVTAQGGRGISHGGHGSV
jgi:hypothetical protein